MIYVLLDNWNEGLELNEVKDFDELAKYLQKVKEDEGGYNRVDTIIFGEIVPWDVIRAYYNLED